MMNGNDVTDDVIFSIGTFCILHIWYFDLLHAVGRFMTSLLFI